AATAALVVGPPDNGACPVVVSTLGAHQRQCQPPTSGGSTPWPHRSPSSRSPASPQATCTPTTATSPGSSPARGTSRRTPGTHPSPAPSTPKSDGRRRRLRYAPKTLSMALPLASSSISLSR